MLIGLQTEVGELADAFKKHQFYGKELDRDNVIEEAGDVVFYLTGLLNGLGLTMDQVLARNVNKLAKRYKYEFSEVLAAARLDKTEETK